MSGRPAKTALILTPTALPLNTPRAGKHPTRNCENWLRAQDHGDSPLAVSGQFTDGITFADKGHRSARKVADRGTAVVDSQMLVERCQEVARPDAPLDRVFTPLVRSTDDLTGSDASPGKQHRIGPWPVVPARLHRSLRAAGNTPSAAGHVRNAW